VSSADANPLHVTPSEFSALLAKKVDEIAQLKPLWTLAQEKGIRIYLAGGGVRGLARYLAGELASHSYAEVSASVLPDFENLFLSKSADIDLVIETNLIESEYRAALGKFGGWDLTPLSKFEALTAIGGPNVEKMLLAPGVVIDPAGAVEDFVRGELRISLIPEKIFYQTPLVRTQAITRMSQALRFARMHQEMSDFEVKDATWGLIAKVVREDDLSGTLMPTQIRRDHRLFRELKKILQNADGDFAAAASVLRESGTLKVLAKSGFYFPFDQNKYDAAKISRRLRALGWKEDEIRDGIRLIWNRTHVSLTWIRSLACRYLMTRSAPWNPVSGSE
jgi:hypothetical protein